MIYQAGALLGHAIWFYTFVIKFDTDIIFNVSKSVQIHILGGPVLHAHTSCPYLLDGNSDATAMIYHMEVFLKFILKV